MINQPQQLCSICGEGHLTYHMDTITVEHNNVREEIDSHYILCDECGVQGGAEEMRKNKRIMIEFKKRASGLLTGDQVRDIRTRLGLSQKEAAALFGGGPVAFSKYENDEVMQSEAMDKLLRLTDALPGALDILRRSAA